MTPLRGGAAGSETPLQRTGGGGGGGDDKGSAAALPMSLDKFLVGDHAHAGLR